MVITKTTAYGQVETNQQTRPFIESEKLAQAADEFPKRLKVCAETCGRHIEHSQ